MQNHLLEYDFSRKFGMVCGIYQGHFHVTFNKIEKARGSC